MPERERDGGVGLEFTWGELHVIHYIFWGKKWIFSFNIKSEKKWEAVHSGGLSKSTWSGREGAVPTPPGKGHTGRAPNPVPLGKTHMEGRGKCCPSVRAPLRSGNFTGLCPVPPLALWVCWLLLSPWVSAYNSVLCCWISMVCAVLLLVGVSEHILKLIHVIKIFRLHFKHLIVLAVINS